MGKHKYIEYKIRFRLSCNRHFVFSNRRYFSNIVEALDFINNYGYEIISTIFNDCGKVTSFIVDEGLGKE